MDTFQREENETEFDGSVKLLYNKIIFFGQTISFVATKSQQKGMETFVVKPET